MDVAEVRLRGQRLFEARLDDLLWRYARPRWRRVWAPSDRLFLESTPFLDTPLGPLNAERGALVRASPPAETEQILERAEAVFAGRVQVLGYPEVTLGEDADLQHDPFSGRRWPDRHGKLLDYRGADYGDPKWVWEVNRCQELPLLCLAWLVSGDDRFAAVARRRMLGWLERSAPGRGIAWSNGFEAGLRGISFALCFDALRGSDLLVPDDARAALLGLWQHGRFAVRDHSFGSSANNHLIGEAAGLATIGLLAPELRDAEQWLELALSWLAREAKVQILPDGTGAEQAFGYTLFVLDLFLLVAALLEQQERIVPEPIRDALARGADALAAQVQDDEPDPAYGDADDGRAVLLDGSRARNARGVAAGLASFLGHGGARALASTPDATALLLFGENGRRRFDAAAPSSPPRSALLEDSGLVVLRAGGVRALFDAGPLGYLAIAAHGHADALQVAMSEGADELIGDPGTGSYFGDSVRRTVFRGTAFHATVVVDGLDQAEQAGPFLWRRHYRCAIRHLDLDLRVMLAEHDGYARLADPVRHRRVLVQLGDGTLLVYDRLDARARHRYVQTWPLHPRLEVTRRDDHLLEAAVDGSPRLLLQLAPSAAAVRVSRGEVEPLRGWWSRRLEDSEPSPIVRLELDRTGGAEFAALLAPARGRHLPDPMLRVDSKARATTIAFHIDEKAYRVRLALEDATSPVQVETGVQEEAPTR
jgi:Heparinase II/III-like protein/Heparinase II/III N-terminus